MWTRLTMDRSLRRSRYDNVVENPPCFSTRSDNPQSMSPLRTASPLPVGKLFLKWSTFLLKPAGFSLAVQNIGEISGRIELRRAFSRVGVGDYLSPTAFSRPPLVPQLQGDSQVRIEPVIDAVRRFISSAIKEILCRSELYVI